jgi:hypothetical protein
MNANCSGSPATKDRYQAFLSHNGADKSLVEELANELQRRGVSCWLAAVIHGLLEHIHDEDPVPEN